MKKNIMNVVSLALLGCLILVSCKKSDKAIAEEPEEAKPTAGFTYTKVSPDDPFTFKFENSSKDFKEIRWEFGDDSTTNEISPTHTFINTGDYRVRMISRNGQGYWAQRETVIKLRPDSVLDFVSTTNSPGVLTLSVAGGVSVSKAEWFSGVAPTNVLIGTDPTVTVNVPSGAFGLFSLRVTTPKGSMATVSSYVSNKGVLKDATLKGFFSVSRDNRNGQTSSEGSLKLIDNSLNSKFLQFDYTGDLWAQFDYEQTPRVITAFC
ncbi:PKD domain-containing protein [Pedobacter sp. BAL39]|uniref:PKD domain-containing protein n=1 Tax=Pedobacter sp. BAL39 TaxID=391596 RepID=UPI0012F7F055|nr:PKD domain-containing protein [Pedobacter sp. BAL39]